MRAYAADLRQFCAFAGRTTEIADIDAARLEHWAATLVGAGYAQASVRRKFAAVRVFFSFWVRRGDLEISPFHRVRLDLAPSRQLPRVLELSDISRLLSQSSDEIRQARTPHAIALARRDHAIVELLFATGIRVGELSSLRVGDYHAASVTLRIRGKGDRERIALLPDTTSRAALCDYLVARHELNPTEDALFVNARGSRLSAQGAANAIGKLARSAGVKRHVTPHMLRHTIATQLLEHGADIRVVQVFLGHSSIATTQRYTHVSKRHLQAALLQHHPNLRELDRTSWLSC